MKKINQHLIDVKQGYFLHLLYTISFFLRLAVMSVAIILHGIFPFFLTNYVSRELVELLNDMKAFNKTED